MAAETNVITTTEMKKAARELDYEALFGESVAGLAEMLGVSRIIPAKAGTVLTKTIVTGELEDGDVDEGDIIPLSQYEVDEEIIGQAKILKHRKATTAEAIQKSGFDDAVNKTDAKMVKDVQKKIRKAFIDSLATGKGEASGVGIQAALADAWGQLQIAFEDDDVNTVYFINPQDIAEYLKTAQITTQSNFGFKYIEDFLGLGTVIMTSQVEKGTFYATASENINILAINVNEAGGLGEAFDFSTDPETGFIGVHEKPDYDRLTSETIAAYGVYIFAEMDAGVIVGEIESNTP